MNYVNIEEFRKVYFKYRHITSTLSVNNTVNLIYLSIRIENLCNS